MSRAEQIAAMDRLRAAHLPQEYEGNSSQTYCPSFDGPTEQCDVCTVLANRRSQSLTGFLLARVSEDESAARHVWPERYTARMLAECEAKRRIMHNIGPLSKGDEFEATVRNARQTAFADVIAELAWVYRDHPDYREEWTP